MSDSMKDSVTDDLQKAKDEGRTRAERVQQILKDAFSQAVDEIKQGSSEIRLIAKDTLSTVVKKLDDKVEPTGEVGVEQPTLSSSELRPGTVFNAIKNRLTAYLQQEYATLSNQSVGLKERLTPLQTKLTERYGDRFVDVKSRVSTFDEKLTDRYGDRYATVKQRLENFKLWYGKTLVQAETVGPGLLQQKQSKFEGEVVANAGTSVAKKEQQIKQQVKQFLQTAVAKL